MVIIVFFYKFLVVLAFDVCGLIKVLRATAEDLCYDRAFCRCISGSRERYAHPPPPADAPECIRREEAGVPCGSGAGSGPVPLPYTVA